LSPPHTIPSQVWGKVLDLGDRNLLKAIEKILGVKILTPSSLLIFNNFKTNF
jgi:hypothetical protein